MNKLITIIIILSFCVTATDTDLLSTQSKDALRPMATKVAPVTIPGPESFVMTGINDIVHNYHMGEETKFDLADGSIVFSNRTLSRLTPNRISQSEKTITIGDGGIIATNNGYRLTTGEYVISGCVLVIIQAFVDKKPYAYAALHLSKAVDLYTIEDRVMLEHHPIQKAINHLKSLINTDVLVEYKAMIIGKETKYQNEEAKDYPAIAREGLMNIWHIDVPDNCYYNGKLSSYFIFVSYDGSSEAVVKSFSDARSPAGPGVYLRNFDRDKRYVLDGICNLAWSSEAPKFSSSGNIIPEEGSSPADRLRQIISKRLPNDKLTILFVCNNNHNRSTSMHLIAKDFAIEHGLSDKVFILSAGTYKRDRIDPLPQAHMETMTAVYRELYMDDYKAAGISDSTAEAFEPSALSKEQIESADIIIIAEEENKNLVIGSVPESRDKVFKFNELLTPEDKNFGKDLPDDEVAFYYIRDVLNRTLFPLLLEFGPKSSSSGEDEQLVGKIIANNTRSLEELEDNCRQQENYADIFLKKVNTLGMPQGDKAKLFANILLYWAGLSEQRRSEFPFKPKWHGEPAKLGKDNITLTPDVWHIIQPYSIPYTIRDDGEYGEPIIESLQYIDRKGRIAIEAVFEKSGVMGSVQEDLFREAVKVKSEQGLIDTGWAKIFRERKNPKEIDTAKRIWEAIIDIHVDIQMYDVNNNITIPTSTSPFLKSFLRVAMIFMFEGLGKEAEDFCDFQRFRSEKANGIHAIVVGFSDVAEDWFREALGHYPQGVTEIASLLAEYALSDKGSRITKEDITLAQACARVAHALSKEGVWSEFQRLMRERNGKIDMGTYKISSPAILTLTVIDSAA